MANKKYNEFPAGTYDTSKIFLQADPSTGALEKVNLPSASSAGFGLKMYACTMSSDAVHHPVVKEYFNSIFSSAVTAAWITEYNYRLTFPVNISSNYLFVVTFPAYPGANDWIYAIGFDSANTIDIFGSQDNVLMELICLKF